jgi:PAS domain S-box-containing protein
VARSCAEALKMLAEPSAYDLVLIDMRMPDQSGLEFVHEARRGRLHMPPFLMISGQGDDDATLATLRLGAADFIVKQSGYLDQLPYRIDQAISQDLVNRLNDKMHDELDARRQAEAALVENEQFALAVASHVPGLLAYWTPDLRCAFANQEHLTWWGRSWAQMKDLRLQDLLGDEQFHGHEPHLRAALGGSAQRFEQTLARPGAPPLQSWVQYAPRRVGGQVHGLFTLVTDISSLKRVQEQQRINDHAVKAVSEGVMITDTDWRITSVNEAMMSIVGYGRSEMLGRTACFLQGPLTDEQTRRDIAAALDRESGFAGEILNYRKDGSTFWNGLTISPVRDEDGRLTHFVGITRDVTAHKLAELELRQLNEELEGHRHHLEELVASRTLELATSSSRW